MSIVLDPVSSGFVPLVRGMSERSAGMCEMSRTTCTVLVIVGGGSGQGTQTRIPHRTRRKHRKSSMGQ